MLGRPMKPRDYIVIIHDIPPKIESSLFVPFVFEIFFAQPRIYSHIVYDPRIKGG